MEIKKQYKRDIYSNYMVLEAQNEDYYEARMLSENSLEGIIPMQVKCVDSISYYYYDISSKQPVSNLFERGQLGYDQLKKIMEGIFGAIEEGRRYLLCENDFVINPEYLYITLSSFTVCLCYYPGYNQDISLQLTGIIEFLMDKADHTDEKAVMLIYGLYKMARKDCSIGNLREVMNQSGNGDCFKEDSIHRVNENYMKEEKLVLKEEPLDNYIDYTTGEVLRKESNKYIDKNKMIIIYSAAAIFLMGILYKMNIVITKGGHLNLVALVCVVVILAAVGYALLQTIGKGIQVKDQEIDAHEGANDITFDSIREDEKVLVDANECKDYSFYRESEDDSLDDYESETVLLADYTKKTVLVSCSSQSVGDIEISDMPFIVGKLKDKVDYVLNSEAVSRLHAKIHMADNDQLLITDLNSKNGTFVNGDRMLANETRKVKEGDEIAFADLRFIIR